jgi:hypothetical protein
MKSIFSNTMIVGLALLASPLVSGEVCYEYDSKYYTLVNAWSDAQGKMHSRTLPASAYAFILVKPDKQLDRLNSHTFVLIDKKTGKAVIEHNTWECYPFRGTTGGYKCHGECDGGRVIVAEDGRLRSHIGMLFGETVDAPGGNWELEWDTHGSLLPAHAIPCPPAVAKLARHSVDVDETYARQHAAFALEPYRYVCYGHKEMRYAEGAHRQPLYADCEITPDPCSEMGMQRFGHYQTEKLARKALSRCQHSIPRKKMK